MKYLKIWQKLTMLGVLFLIPFAIVTYMMVSSINSEKVDFAILELLGTEYYTPLSAMLKDLQQHNSLAGAWLSGDPSFKERVTAKGKDIETDLAKMDGVDQRLDRELHTSGKWSDLRTAISDLLGKTSSLSATDSLEQHQKVIDATLMLITKVSDNSKLTLDPDIDSYYLMNVVMSQGPLTSDFLAQARTLLCAMAARRIGTPNEFDKLNRLSILADFSEDGVANSLRSVLAFNKTIIPEVEPRAHANAAVVKKTTDTIRNLVANRKLDVSAADHYATMTRNINLLFDLEGHSTEALNRLLNIRLEHWRHEIEYALGGAALGLLSVSIIGFLIMRDITIPLQRVVSIANQIAIGEENYSIRAVKQSNDELGVLIDAFNKMLKEIQKRDGDLRKSHLDLEKRVKERTEEVVNSLSLVHATLESTADGILVTDGKGQVTSFNQKFLKIWQIPPEVASQRSERKIVEITSPQLKDSRQFLSTIEELRIDPEKESFDMLELNDGKIFEQYSKPQYVEGNCVGRVWSFRDITARRRAEAEIARMHKELLDTSRQAGMAEVATSVLHNVGNVLNSVNVSSTLVSDQIRTSKVANLFKVVALLNDHAADIGAFLTSDPKGKQLTNYLRQLGEHLVGEQTTALKELSLLQENIEHIKDIVVMQQSYARISDIVETVKITELVEEALRLNVGFQQRHDVAVLREYEDLPPMDVEKHKILQIVVNLIRNAMYACDESLRKDKQMTLRVSRSDDRVDIAVSDNGVGIPQENLTRIFNHGFTTRKAGHGFGLHSAVLVAMQMGGSLTVQSDGPESGATFTLKLPYTLHKN